MALLTVYFEPVYALLDSRAIPNVMFMKLVPTPMSKRIIVADGSRNGVEGTVLDVPVGFGDIVIGNYRGEV